MFKTACAASMSRWTTIGRLELLPVPPTLLWSETKVSASVFYVNESTRTFEVVKSLDTAMARNMTFRNE